MKTSGRVRKVLMTATMAAVVALAQQPAPDNTKTNARDRDEAATTADQQGNSKADVEMTAKIRRAINDRDGLSTYAKNVKVITKDGAVVLRGPVRDETERDVIAKIAMSAAGEGKVTNRLEVAPAK